MFKRKFYTKITFIMLLFASNIYDYKILYIFFKDYTK
ncbi:hypothetical protein HH_0941 [Helicobacter hepaticus ATCC 51449]|uniref:Uncharacterized protein n=1 Tax=Helicobacter hepaticus (strain ATCC 51449 / 3B1) TaxID=235279 RepID=Q7VHM5_HELHP|nr:hypothetical protein HH_0941 [Helicobacter hepaticus ATCC 51449]